MTDYEIAIDVLFRNPAQIGINAGYTDLRPFHNQWIIDWVMHCLKNNAIKSFQAARGSYKSTCEEIVIAILMIIAPEKTIGLFRKTDDSVAKTTRGVKKILDAPYTKFIANAYSGQPLRIRAQNEKEVSTYYNCSPGGQRQFIAQGIGGTLTSQHFDIIITDDIVTLADSTSSAEREATKRNYSEILRLLNDGGAVLNTGTPWHPQDAFMIMPPPEKWDWQRLGMYSDARIKQLKNDTTPAEFAANYELHFIADENALFGTVKTDVQANFPIDGSVMYIDPAFSHTGHDYTAIAIGSFAKDKLHIAGFAYRRGVE